MTQNSERNMVQEQMTRLDLEYMSLGDALIQIHRMIKRYGPTATISSDTEPYSESNKEYLNVNTSRLENDEEYDIRMRYEQALREFREKNDAAEFERLTKKFGKAE